MNNRQKNKLMKYTLIAFVLYLVWRKMSSGYEMSGSTSNVGSEEYCLKTTGTKDCRIAEKAGMKIGSVKAAKSVDVAAVAKNVGSEEYCLKTTGTTDCRIAEKAGMKIGSVKAGEIGLKSGGEIGISSATPKCRTEFKCATNYRDDGTRCVNNSKYGLPILPRLPYLKCDPVEAVVKIPTCRTEFKCATNYTDDGTKCVRKHGTYGLPILPRLPYLKCN